MELKALHQSYPQYNFHFPSKAELSIIDYPAVEEFISANEIDFCINCAAYTQVDRAEEEREQAFKINGEAVGNLAKTCRKYNSRMIHISTDYVFSGDGTVPYTESDQPMPVNLYGRSKLAGEIQAVMSDPSFIIIRTSWLYSIYGKNFVKTMVRLLGEKESIGVVNDQHGSPTYAADLADVIMKIISSENPEPGVYHYSNKGVISWYDLAVAISEIINSKCIVNPISTDQYPTPAKRPGFSAFNTTLIENQFGIVIPQWRASLEKCIALLQTK
jgi:dTDP-4-dehydrorhamnose reductase